MLDVFELIAKSPAPKETFKEKLIKFFFVMFLFAIGFFAAAGVYCCFFE